MKVILSTKAQMQMAYYIAGINYEISGLGIVEKLENGDLYVPEIFLLEQEVTGVETVLDREAVSKFFTEKLDDQNFPIEKVKLWWHSHVNMDVFWSGVDTTTIEQLDTDEDVENWWLSIVGNKKGERLARVDIYKPHRMFMDHLPIEMGRDLELKDAIEKEIEDKVSIKSQTPKYVYPQSNNFDNRPKGPWTPGGYEERESGIIIPKGYRDDDGDDYEIDITRLKASKRLRRRK